MIIYNNEDIRNNRNTAGIYRFRNKINNKSYIGQSLHIGKRIREHLCAANKSCGTQYSIHKAISKYGIENFEIEILTIFEPHENIRKNLDLAEKIYIYIYDSFKNGYNENAGGNWNNMRKWTEKQRKHVSEVLTGRTRPYEYTDPRSKTVFLYKIDTKEYFSVPCVKFIKEIDVKLKAANVQCCASGKRYSTCGYLCAYSKEELQYKIEHIKFGKRCRLK